MVVLGVLLSLTEGAMELDLDRCVCGGVWGGQPCFRNVRRESRVTSFWDCLQFHPSWALVRTWRRVEALEATLFTRVGWGSCRVAVKTLLLAGAGLHS